MYQALYRKYRPKTFNDVVGQDIIKRIITNSVKRDNLSHAYLFYGLRGTGKTSVAKLVAKQINCFNLKNDNPCGVCEYCLGFDRENLDVIEIDAASNNGVDEIRDLKSKINIMPSLGKYKVYIIDEVHMLSMSAFNALLKTLEEPPKHVVFILATTEITKIPDTIISRCQRLDFKRISDFDIEQRLKHICESENIQIDDEVLKKISQISNGGLRDAIGLLDKVFSFSPDKKIGIKELNEVAYITSKEDVEQLIKLIQMFDMGGYLELINKLNNKGKNLINLVDELIVYSRDVVLNNPNAKDNGFYFSLINELNDLSTKMKTSSFPKILLEMLIIEMNQGKAVNSCSRSDNKRENKNISQKINTFEELKSVRINNALFGANKKHLAELKSKWKEINVAILGDKYSKILSFLPDLTIMVASDTNLLISSKYDSIIENSIENFLLIEDAIRDFYKKEYKLMLITTAEWTKIKKEYIDNTKNSFAYTYVEEKVNIKDLLKGEKVI